MNNIDVGKAGEDLAVEFLLKKGYDIIERNYRNKIGEIDIIAKTDDIVSFIEVKSRNSKRYGYAYEAVNKRKQEKIMTVAMIYMQENSLRDVQLCFDIIEIYFNENKMINHIKNAFN